MPRVLSGVVAVTGSSGFIASHVVHQLLQEGFQVRACVRSKNNTSNYRHLVQIAAEVGCSEQLSFYEADLLKVGSYDEAFAGVAAVVHTAAVVQVHAGSDQAAVVQAAVDGTRNVLTAAMRSPTVSRVIVTSSIAAVYDLSKPDSYVFSEWDWNTWSSPERGDAYGFAKTESEKLAFEMSRCANWDLVVINPGVVLGPCYTKAHTKGSAAVVREMLYGNRQQNYVTAVVDVRDVAKAHLQALQIAAAAYRRFVVVNMSCDIRQLAEILQQHVKDHAVHFSTYPGWLMWCAWLLSSMPLVGGFVLDDFRRNWIRRSQLLFDNAASKETLRLQYTPIERTLEDTARSMLQYQLVNVKPQSKL